MELNRSQLIARFSPLRRKTFAVSFMLIAAFSCRIAYAGQNIAIIPWRTGNDNLDIIAEECARKAESACRDLGVYEVRPPSHIKQIRDDLQKRNQGDISVKSVQEISGSDRTMIIVISREGTSFSATLHLINKSGEYAQKMTLRTGIQSILPNLIIREIIRLHENARIEITVKKLNSDGTVVVDAGDSNHINTGDLLHVNGTGTIRILSTGRFESAAVCDFKVVEGQTLEVPKQNDGKALNETNEREIHAGLVRTFGAEYTVQKGIPDPEKRFIEGTLFVSMGGSLILPAYGAFLSTYYMGFKNPEPAYGGLLLSASLEFGALLYTPFTTDKSSWRSYLPVHSADKSNRDLRLQRYLWGTVPFTFAVTYCDQLSYQYELRKVLPPLFDHPDRAAAVLSLFIPGGGYFYKGYRAVGWGVYCSELALGGYAAANFGSAKSRNALIALGSLKLVEILTAAMIPCSYGFYNHEAEHAPNPAFTFNLSPDTGGKLAYSAGFTIPF